MIEVYKYGGTVLNKDENRDYIYKFFEEKIKKGIKIFMVVSAFGREKDCFSTDNLSKNIELLDNIDKDIIMTFGEIYSSLIIKNELKRLNFKVSSVNFDEIGIMCDNNYQNGNIIGVDMSYLKELIEHNDIVVVPGFIGESIEGKIISLGRNTSDLTAFIIGDYFKLNKVNIIKEVDGVYKKDPKVENSKLIKNISYDEIISLINAGSKMFSLKAIEYAKDKEVMIEIKSLFEEKGSVISNKESNEKILFVNLDKEQIKVVFKGMEIFNEIFKKMINENVKFDELVIDKDIVYIKGDSELIKKLIDGYL